MKNNGVLFENEMLQIGVKSEYKKNLGQFLSLPQLSLSLSSTQSHTHPHSHSICMYVYTHTLCMYTHTPVVLECFLATNLLPVFCSNVSLAGSLEENLNIQAKLIDSTIENGAQV